MKRPVPNVMIIKRINELRDKGYGYRNIANTLCEEEGICISYRTAERWHKKYSWILDIKSISHSLRQVTKHTKLSVKPVNNPDLDIITSMYKRLGKTEKAILRVITSIPELDTWSAADVYAILKYEGYKSRQAIYQAMRRLEKRGILARVKGTGRFRLIAFEPSSFAVHNLRISDVLVTVEGRSANLTLALFDGERCYGRAPITQYELNSDIPVDKEKLKELVNFTGWGELVIYPKLEEGVIRVDYRFWPKPSARIELSMSSKDMMETIGRIIARLGYEIMRSEAERLRIL